MAADCRAAAARVLAAVSSEGSSLGEPLGLESARLEPRDRALLQQLCYGTLRGYYRLDGILQQTLQKKLKRKDADIHCLLLCGLHQLLDMRTPDHAAISATVEACRSLGKPWATGLVNGILRRCSRETEKLLSGLTDNQRLDHPPWLLEQLRSAWPEHWQQLVAANNSHPPMCLRVNQQAGSRDDYLALLAEAELSASACLHSEVGIRLEQAVDVARLPGFADGLVSVQDEAAQLAARLLQPAAGERVLDACSAPGGKACHLLEQQPSLELTAMDSEASRLGRVEENLERLGLAAAVIVGDGRQPPTELAPSSFDSILVDAPCSGSGVIRRHPDIKLLRLASDIEAMAQTQLEILRGLWPLLAAGGKLLYATCSVLPAENQQLLQRFLDECPDASVLPRSLDCGIEQDGAIQLLSDPEGTDGMFYALLQKAG
ncbi:MAG: 16S rRNA (cytosine(967)-C(5))-methyltransferase RsmB [Halieaceae bacterium]